MTILYSEGSLAPQGHGKSSPFLLMRNHAPSPLLLKHGEKVMEDFCLLRTNFLCTAMHKCRRIFFGFTSPLFTFNLRLVFFPSFASSQTFPLPLFTALPFIYPPQAFSSVHFFRVCLFPWRTAKDAFWKGCHVLFFYDSLFFFSSSFLLVIKQEIRHCVLKSPPRILGLEQEKKKKSLERAKAESGRLLLGNYAVFLPSGRWQYGCNGFSNILPRVEEANYLVTDA
ncbi:hypothetical protein NPIL_624881 [Nephila pilipes]|uniref:Uncharacterized protein n=1 Tax=Nephila pilipes TaxID=299642 RepID=A0A8X6N9C0_NEPPI|nr:hypothetical protein NPIL_624881 [Nephila pilipes]